MPGWDPSEYATALATQSTVSRRLASLQDGMGVRLLQRTADSYTLTLAGESIRTHVERVEAEALSVERAVAGHDMRLEGLVRVTSSQLLSNHLLTPGFAALHMVHHGILIEALPELQGDPRSGTCAAVSPVSASTARCSLRQAQHVPAERPGIQSALRPAPPGDRYARAQGRAKHETQHQHQLDGQVGLQRLLTGNAPLRRRPARERRLVQPQGEVTAPPQPGLIRRPVREAVAGPRNAMA